MRRATLAVLVLVVLLASSLLLAEIMCNLLIEKKPDIIVYAFRGYNGWIARWELQNIGTHVLRNMKLHFSEVVKGNVSTAFDTTSFYWVVGSDTFRTPYGSGVVDCSTLELKPDTYAIEFYAALLDSGSGFSSPQMTLKIDSVSFDLGHGGIEYYSEVPVYSQLVVVDWVVPVELSSFTSQVREDTVVLKWTTTTESNNYGFEIQRRSSQEGGWKRIGFVAGHGTSFVPYDYSYQDSPEESGSYLYRLKQIDTDGTFAYSPEVLVEVQTTTAVDVAETSQMPKDFALYQNYPNPFNPATTISFSVPYPEHVSVVVYNTMGREVKTLVDTYCRQGINSAVWDGTDGYGQSVASGIYIYQIIAGEFSEAKKMLLKK